MSVRNYNYSLCNNPGEQFSEMNFVISLEWLLLQAAGFEPHAKDDERRT
jgi:hypothetical protein